MGGRWEAKKALQREDGGRRRGNKRPTLERCLKFGLDGASFVCQCLFDGLHGDSHRPLNTRGQYYTVTTLHLDVQKTV